MDLTLLEGENVHISGAVRGVVVDHLDEVQFLILLLVHKASTHIDKVYLSAFETGYFYLHMKVFIQFEVVMV